LEKQKIEDELAEKKKIIKELEAILASEKRILEIIATETEEIKTKYAIDHLFFGSNRNPPITITGNNPVRISPTNNSILCPFFDLYKTDIVQFAIDCNAQELFNITHTCTEQQQGRCNNCWQCQERAWAFNKLNLTDTGTL
jgi:7-cyano-7-deazaguanine synthase in queuosine biosynthesis